MRFIEKAQNQAGTVYALALQSEGQFGVWVLCNNYARGKIVSSWRYCLINSDENTARTLFKKKLKGKVQR